MRHNPYRATTPHPWPITQAAALGVLIAACILAGWLA